VKDAITAGAVLGAAAGAAAAARRIAAVLRHRRDIEWEQHIAEARRRARRIAAEQAAADLYCPYCERDDGTHRRGCFGALM